jgi:hypothetical protein
MQGDERLFVDMVMTGRITPCLLSSRLVCRDGVLSAANVAQKDYRHSPSFSSVVLDSCECSL